MRVFAELSRPSLRESSCYWAYFWFKCLDSHIVPFVVSPETSPIDDHSACWLVVMPNPPFIAVPTNHVPAYDRPHARMCAANPTMLRSVSVPKAPPRSNTESFPKPV